MDAVRRKNILICLFFLFFILPVNHSLADGKISGGAASREKLPLPISMIFERLVEYSIRKDYSSLLRTIDILSAHLDYIDTKYNKKIKLELLSAVNGSVDEIIGTKILELVYFDMVDLLIEGELLHEKSEKEKKYSSAVKKAYRDFLILSKYKLISVDFDLDQRVRNSFKDLTIKEISSFQFKSIRNGITNSISDMLGIVEKEGKYDYRFVNFYKS